MGTDEPKPIRSASEKLMMTNGMARLSAANAVPPRNWPTNTPSIVWYSAEASMLIAPGIAAIKNSLSGAVLANKVAEFIGISFLVLPVSRKRPRRRDNLHR